MKKRLVSSLSVALLLGSMATAGAENRAGTATITPFLGGYTFDGEQHLDTMPVYGMRAGYNLTERFGAEAVFDFGRTESTRNNDDTNVLNYHLDLLYHFFPANRAVPFLMAGIGGVTLDDRDSPLIPDRTKLAYNYGLGVKYALTDMMQLRGEVRHLMHHYDSHTFHNIEYGLGLGFVLGGVAAAPEPVAAAEPVAVVERAPAPAPVAPPPAAPRASISVAPSQTLRGGSTTLSWECLDSQSARIEPGIGAVATRGSRSVTASDSTEYTLTCVGAGGEATSASRLTVSEPARPAPPRPACTMTAVPATITEGQSSRLDWECTNAESAEISPDLGQVAARGSRTVSPVETTTYTVTGTGAGTSATASSTVAVNPLPPEKRSISLDVRFDTGKAVVKQAYHDEIGRVAAFLKEYPNVTGTIEGHTDNVGDRDMNKKLSQRRADAVLNYLVDKYGIERSRLNAVGYGPDKPIADNKTAAGKQKNRRTVATFETTVKGRK